jgi:hypothetical protein
VSDNNGSKYYPVPGKIPGTTINLSGLELVMAPLNLDGVKQFLELQGELSSASTNEQSFTVTARILALSLQRNYPDITPEDILRLLDVANAQTAMMELVKLSGMRLGPLGEPTPAPQ